MGATKNSPKYEQNVLILFLLALPAAYGQQELLRLEKSADAMGATYSIALYGYDRVKMEAAVDAAFDEVRRLGARSIETRPSSRSRFHRSFSSFLRPVSNTAGRAKVRSISQWAL